jgi:hypothetical protein
LIVFLRKNEGVLTVVSIVLLALISIYFGMVSHQEMALFHSAPFLTALMGAKGPMLPSWLNYLMFYPLAIVNAFLLNRIIQQEGLVTKLSNIPILIFVILLLCLPEAFRSPLAMVATTVVIIVLSYSLKVLNEVHTDRALFNASFLSGGLILVQPLYFPMFFSLIILLLLTGVVSVKRLLLAALGLLTPIYLVFGLVFLFNPTEVQAFNDLLVVSDSLMNISPTQISFLTLMLVSILFGNALTASSSTLRERRKWHWIMMFFIALSLSVFLGSIEFIVISTMVPSVVILSKNFVLIQNKWIARGLFFGLLAVCLINLLA